MPEKRGVTLHAIRAAAVLLLSVFVTTCEPQTLGGPGPVEPGVDGAGAPAVAVEARVIEPLDVGMTNPAGLTFSPTASLFFVLPRGLEAPESETELGMITLAPDPAGTIRLGVEVADPVNLAFDAMANRLVLLDTERQALVAMPAGPDGRLSPERMVRLDLGHAGLGAAQGLTVDPASGRLFVLDAVGSRIVRLEPDAGPFLSEIDLAPLGAATLRGIAFDPTTRHLHVLDPRALVLYELTEAGAVVATRDLSAFELRDPQGMTFGPSGDTTDDPAELSLYLADRGEPTGAPEARGFAETGKIVELTLLAPRALRPSFATAPLEPAVAVRTIATSAFSPPSPDPSGIAYLPHVGTLLISDGEVNEMPIFVGVNLFEMTTAGMLVSTSVTLPHSDEPVGLTYNPSNGHLFSSDDTGTRSVYEWDPGADGLYGTSDDLVTSFATAPFGSSDPEGVTYDVSQGVLFVVDGVNAEVYRIAPGPNGLFDGGDDVVTHFDTQGFGLTDPEGIAWDSDYGHL
ncbi:MAG TPA: hypothetical protein VLE71_05345, partial [Actinomycetota bacterium]|nr:hypothetical protein [Actinomycetota bacterium]